MELLQPIFDFLLLCFDVIKHLDLYINQWAGFLGVWTYALCFLIIFCESGVVLTPFLPGDSLLFALGALTSVENPSLEYGPLALCLFVAAVLGGAFNFRSGLWAAPRLQQRQKLLWLNQDHLRKTQEFYVAHGGKTIVIARFIPIIRTFAPFVAGLCQMDSRRFNLFNFFGAIAWVPTILLAGHFFGNLPIVKKYFGLLIPMIIIVSLVPIIWEYFSHRAKTRQS